MAELIRKLLSPRERLFGVHDLTVVDLSMLDGRGLAERGLSRADVVEVARRTMI